MRFFSGELVELGDPYILRDYRGQAIRFQPFQYNPVSKVLRVYKNIQIELKYSDDEVTNPFHRVRSTMKVQSDYNQIYRRHFINYNNGAYRYTPVEEGGRLLIISPSTYHDELAPFVQWKKEKGIYTEVVDIATIGNNRNQIHQYIKDYYNNHAGDIQLTYVLLVGDHADVNSHDADYDNQNGVSDPKYGFITGNDCYPEVFVGRFSAQNPTHVTTMVNRTLAYEKNPADNGDWYKTGIGIASDEGPGDNNEYDWDHIRKIRTDLLGFTYSAVSEFYDGSQGGEDASGYPSANQLKSAVNAGATIINYAGHGDDQSCVTTGFSNSDVNALTNVNKYPYFISVACDNGKFSNTTCFAEHWLRATDNSGNPTGAIGTLMSSILMSWSPPMLAQDEMMDIMVEKYSNNIKRTLGGISYNGDMKMLDGYGNESRDCVETWLLFGDPSTMNWTDVPAAMTVSHDAVVSDAVTSISVTCDTEGALVGIVQNGEIFGTGIVSGGVAVVDVSLSGGSDLTVTVTAFNHKPQQSTISVSGVGVENIESALVLAPNPVANELVISGLNGVESTVQIVDALGRVLSTTSTRNQSRTILNTSELSQGSYFLVIQSNTERITKSFIKE